VITTHAEAIGMSSVSSARNASQVIVTVLSAQSLRRAPPVIAGSSVPLRDAHTPLRNDGVSHLIRLSRPFTALHRLMVFVIGAGTDVASALLVDPTLADRIQVVAMGFDEWPRGGDGFNVKNDPIAWQVIFDSRVPVVIGSSALTKRDLQLTRKEGAALLRSHGPIGEYLNSLFDEWLTQRADLVAQFVAPETWVVWDEVVVAYALGLAHGDDVPRPRLQTDLSFYHPATNQRITWLTQIDTQAVWLDFVRKIDVAQERDGRR